MENRECDELHKEGKVGRCDRLFFTKKASMMCLKKVISSRKL